MATLRPFSWSKEKRQQEAAFQFNVVYWEKAEDDHVVRPWPYQLKLGGFLVQQENDSDPSAQTVRLAGRLPNSMELELQFVRQGNVSQITHLTPSRQSVAAVHLIEPQLRTSGRIRVGDAKYVARAGATYFEHYWTPVSCRSFLSQWWKWLVLHLSNHVQAWRGVPFVFFADLRM